MEHFLAVISIFIGTCKKSIEFPKVYRPSITNVKLALFPGVIVIIGFEKLNIPCLA